MALKQLQNEGERKNSSERINPPQVQGHEAEGQRQNIEADAGVKAKVRDGQQPAGLES